MRPLRKLTSLNSLYLANNKISAIDSLSTLPKLWSLYLQGNQVSNIIPLQHLKWLSSLNLSDNKISELAPFSSLTEIRYLILNNNQIKNLEPLITICKKDFEGEKKFSPYLRLYLSGNPMEPQAATKQITQLKSFGVRIQFK